MHSIAQSLVPSSSSSNIMGKDIMRGGGVEQQGPLNSSCCDPCSSSEEEEDEVRIDSSRKERHGSSLAAMALDSSCRPRTSLRTCLDSLESLLIGFVILGCIPGLYGV
jgi:hypothetical protein